MYTRGLGQDYGPTMAQLTGQIPAYVDNPGALQILENLPLVGPYTVGSTSPSEAKTQAALSASLTPVSSGFDWTSLMNQYGTPLVIGGGILLALVFFGGGGRRR